MMTFNRVLCEGPFSSNRKSILIHMKIPHSIPGCYRDIHRSTGFILRLPVVILFLLSCVVLAEPEQPRYQDTSLSFKARAQDLVAHMTLEEKIPQLINDAPAIPRLGVREYNWWNEGLHGVAALGDATVFPQAIGMAATWDDQLIHQTADIISTEFRAKHYANQHRFGGSDWFAGLTVWSPNVNIFRDPRWGRGQETYGEDPYLSGRLGVAFVKGLQGDDPHFLKTVATPKHYAVHSGPEATRHQDNFNPSPKDLEETYLPAFRATIREAEAESVMCAYNAIDGVPACANSALMVSVLREKWGFDGVLVSDCGAVYDVYHDGHHGYTKTPEEGIQAVFAAGLDLICGDANEANHIHAAIKKGLLSESRIDQSLVRLFTARMRLGQFDPRADVFPNITAAHNDTAEHRKLASVVAEKSLVLLKNKNQFLPLGEGIGKIFVTGPNADSLEALVGNYNGKPSQPVTVLKGLQSRFGEGSVTYAPGSQLIEPVQEPVDPAALCVDRKCRKRGLAAEYYADKTFADKNYADKTHSGKPQIKRVDATAALGWKNEIRSGAVRWSGFLQAPESGQYTFRYRANGGYRIWLGGELLLDAWNVDWRPSIASGSITLQKGQRYPIRIEAFQRGEAGDEQLLWSLPSDPAAQKALALAESADVVVFAGGLTAQLEGEEIPIPVEGYVGGDKTDLQLPAVQKKLLQKLYATGKPVVLVLMSGSALAVNDADQNATAILQAWYPGGQGGEAIASLLAGDFSPAGRLPVTFYQSVEQLPPFNDYSMAHRTYKYFDQEVLYPFGYGLTYTTFAYSDIKVSPARWRQSDTVKVSVVVSNTGEREADEVVQLYVTHDDVKNSPLRSLTGFQRIHLSPGEKRKVTFTLNDRDLSVVDADGKRHVAPGTATFWVGGGQPVVREGLPAVAGGWATLQIDKAINNIEP